MRRHQRGGNGGDQDDPAHTSLTIERSTDQWNSAHTVFYIARDKRSRTAWCNPSNTATSSRVAFIVF